MKPHHRMTRRTFARSLAALSLGAAAAGATSGCNVIGAVAQFAPEPDVGSAYANLKGQTVAVMVWVDRGARIDYPSMQADVARGLTNKLSQLTNPKDKHDKPTPELEGIRYLDPMTVIRFQDDHPELEGMPPTDVATRLGVTRVIYIEVKDFQTRSSESVDLYKGTVLATLQVLEVTPGPDKTAKVAYSNNDLRVTYPPNRPEGVAFDDTSAPEIYNKTVDEFTTQVAFLFFRHPSGH